MATPAKDLLDDLAKLRDQLTRRLQANDNAAARKAARKRTRKADRPRCGARTRAGGSCQAPAGWRSDVDQPLFPSGRCRMHGGNLRMWIHHHPPTLDCDTGQPIAGTPHWVVQAWRDSQEAKAWAAFLARLERIAGITV